MTKKIDLIDMEFDKQWCDKFQAEIDRLKVLKEKNITISYIDKRDEYENNIELYHLTYNLCNNLILQKMFPFDLDNSYGFDVIFMDKFPVIPSYEKIDDNLYILWDTDHDITKLANYFQSDFNRITDLFIKGIEKIKPDILALELANDVGQEIIDGYLKDKIFRGYAKKQLNEITKSPQDDDFTLLLDYAKNNNINPVAIDVTKEYYDNLFQIPEIKLLVRRVKKEFEKNLFKANASSNTFFKRKEKLDYELSRHRDEYMIQRLDGLTKEGKTLFIVGSVHRPNLLEALKI